MIPRERRKETSDVHGRTFIDPIGESLGVGRDFYVTVIDEGRTGFLLGPFDTHGEALAKVDAGRRLAEEHCTKALFGGFAYGTASAPHGTEVHAVFGEGASR